MNQDFWSEERTRLLKTRIKSEDIRVLTLWQPWASFIALGFKQFETRGWNTNYRGKILIHAAQRKPDRNDVGTWADVLKIANHPLYDQRPGINIYEQPYGAILAIADLTDCKMMSMAEKGEAKDPDFEWIEEQSELELSVGDWRLGRFAWRLENVIAAPTPIPYKNGQGLQRLKVERLR